jgi:hypothetical protein
MHKETQFKKFLCCSNFFGVCPYFETGDLTNSALHEWYICVATAVSKGGFNVTDTIQYPTNLIFCYVNISMDQAVRHLPLSEESQVALEQVLL